jgi:type I restriction enzyme S subunit
MSTGFVESRSRFRTVPYQLYARVGSGHTPSRKVDEYWEDCSTPWITTGDVKHLRSGTVQVLNDTEEKISELGLANSSARIHPAGTVVLSRTASVGFSAIMGTDMATSQDFHTWTPGPELEPRFLLWVLRAMKAVGDFDRLMYGSTHKTIYKPDLDELRGPLPDLETQRRIADWLDVETERINRVLVASEQQLRLAEEVLSADSAVLLGVNGNAPFTALPGAVPAGYIPLWLAAKTFSGKTLQTEQSQECEIETPYLKASNIGYEGVDTANLELMWANPTERAALRVRDGDVFVIEGGATAGKAAQLGDEPAQLTILQNHVHCVRALEGFSQRFLYWVLRAYYGSGWYPVLAAAVTFGSLPAIKLRALPIPKLELRAQEGFVADLDDRLAAVHSVRARTARFEQLLNERKQALITAAVTGEITV